MPKKNRNQTTVGSRIRFTLKHCPPTLWLKSHLEFSAVAQPSSMGLNPASLQTSRGRSTQSTVIPRLYRDFLASFLYEKLNGDLTGPKYFILGLCGTGDPGVTYCLGIWKVLSAYLIKNLTGQGSDLCALRDNRFLSAPPPATRVHNN